MASVPTMAIFLAEEALPTSAAAAWPKLCWHSNWRRQLRQTGGSDLLGGLGK